VSVLARRQGYQGSGRKNLPPSLFSGKEPASEAELRAAHAARVAGLLAAHPAPVLVEHVAPVSQCDELCAVPALAAAELRALGAGLLPPAIDLGAEIRHAPGIDAYMADRVVQTHRRSLGICLATASAGELEVKLGI